MKLIKESNWLDRQLMINKYRMNSYLKWKEQVEKEIRELFPKIKK
jgi:hypothetical protein